MVEPGIRLIFFPHLYIAYMFSSDSARSYHVL